MADEYITRESALEAVDKRIQMLQKDAVFRKKHGDIDLVGVKPFINAIPAADVRPVVHARWVDSELDGVPSHCSECKYPIDRFYKTHYCPNCGAQMDADMREVSDDPS